MCSYNKGRCSVVRPANRHDCGVGWCGGAERGARDTRATRYFERSCAPIARPPSGGVRRQDQLGAHEGAAEQTLHDGGHRGERRVGHDEERSAGEPEVARVGLDDLYWRAGEALPEQVGARRMQLDGDDTCAARDQMRGDRAGAGTDVEHQIALRDPGVADEPAGPAVSELMPSPPSRSLGGHGAP